MNKVERWKRNSILYLSSQLISQFGTSIVQYAIFWYITLMAKSGVVLTITVLVGFLPTFILSPFAGVLADRYSKKKIIIISDTIIAIVTLILAIAFFAGYESIILLLSITFIRAIGTGFQTPAGNSLVPQFVPKEKLISFNGLMTGTLSLINIASPAVSAMLLNVLEFYQILFVDIITAFIGVSILIFLKVSEKKNNNNLTYFEDIKLGIKYIKGKSYLILLFLFIAIQYFLASPEAFLTVLQVIRNFGDEVYRLSLIEMAFFLGMFIGGLILAKIKGFKNRIYTIISAIGILGFLSLVLSLKISFILYIIIIFFIGLMVVSYNTAATVFLQEKTPLNYQGRVFGIFNMIYSSMFPLGLLVFGPLADIVSIESILRVTGFLMLILVAIMMRCKSLITAGNSDHKDIL